MLHNPEPVVHFSGFGESSLDFVLKCHVADVLTGVVVRTELSLRIIERLKAEGIEIPFPQRDLNIKFGDEHEPVAVLAEKLVGAKSKAAAPVAAELSEGKPPAPKRPRKKANPKMRADSMDDGGSSDGGDR